MKRHFLAALLLSSVAHAQIIPSPGKDDVGGTITGVVNTYYPGTGQPNAGDTSLQLGARNPSGSSLTIRAGDLILVMQMQDATLDSSDDDRYGDGATDAPASGSTGGTAGQYEFAVAFTDLSPSGALEVRGARSGGGLLNAYRNADATPTRGAQRYQIVRVPQFSSVTLGDGLTAAAWNGSSGGVLALDVAGTMTLAGTVDVSGKGFRGAGGRLLNGAIGPLGEPIEYRVNAATGTDNDGGKGEGIAGTPRFVNQNGSLLDLGLEGYPLGSAGFGAPGNAGGGGTNATGGGGGGNGGAGGRGGDNWSPSETTASQRHPQPLGGFGGARDTSLNLALGGGGGAGANRNFLGAHGGAGGGIVILRSARVAGSGAILADGSDGVSFNQSGSAGNVGGGGAGGCVLIAALNPGALTGWTISASGGAGGSVGGGTTVHAAGGGGGGGKILLSGSANADNIGGPRGTSPAEFDANNGGTGAIPATHLPGTGEAGPPPSLGINAVGDVPGVPPGAAVVPVLTVTKRTLLASLEAGESLQYELEVVNAAGRAPATGVALRDDALPVGFSFVRLEGVTLAGGATGSVTPEIGGPGNAPTFGVAGDAARGFTLPALGRVTLRFTVAVGPQTAGGTYQNPASASYLDPARTVENGLALTRYDAAQTLEDVTVRTFPAPIAGADRSSTTSDTSVLIAVLNNDSNPAGGALQIDLEPSVNGVQSQFTVTGRGVFAVEGDRVRFTPQAGFAGEASLEYIVVNRLGAVSNRAPITVTVNSSVPVALDDAGDTTSDAVVVIPILQNDRNPVAGALSIDLDPDAPGVQTTRAFPGGLFELQGANLRFTPTPGTGGVVSLEYTITNAAGYESNRATVRVTVRRVTASLAGSAFTDSSGDGLRQSGEAGFADVIVEITDASGTRTTRTDASGAYRLEVRPGAVRVRVIVPAGWSATSATNLVVSVPVGDATAPDFGFAQPQLRLELRVPSSRLSSGQSVPFELRLTQTVPAALRNVSLRLRLPKGFAYRADQNATVTSTQRTENGALVLEYVVPSIPAGQTFSVRGLAIVTPAAPRDTALEWQLEGSATAGSLDAPSALVAQSVRQAANVAGDQAGSLVGRVYRDLDGNGGFSSGDQPVPEARVLLSNGLVATTDRDGRYSFTALPAGRYLVRPENSSSEAAAVVIDSLGVTLRDLIVTEASSPINPFLGQLEASAGYGAGGFSAALGLRGVVSGSFGGVQVTAVANGVLSVGANGLRFQGEPLVAPSLANLTADASRVSALGASDDGFYLRLETPAWQLTYGRVTVTALGAFSSAAAQQGLRFDWQGTGVRASASLGAVASRRSNQTTLAPYGFAGTGGTRYALELEPSGIIPGSEIVTVVTRDARNPDLRARPDTTLQRDAEYRLDPDTGAILLFAPLATTDRDGNPQFLVVTYAAKDAGAPQLIGAARVDAQIDQFSISASLYRFSTDAAPLVAFGAGYASGGWRAALELGWASDFAGQGSLEYRDALLRLSVQYRQLGAEYTGPQPEAPGLNLLASGGLSLGAALGNPLGDDLTIEGNLAHRTPYAAEQTPSTTLGASVGLRFGTQVALAGYSARFAATPDNPGGFVTLGYRATFSALEIRAEQLVPVTRFTNGETTFSLRYALSDTTRLALRTNLVYAPTWRGSLWLGVETDTADAQYRAGLSLPSASGDAVNATLALSARWALTDALFVDIAAQGEIERLNLALNLGAVYTGDQWRTSARLETSVGNTTQAGLTVNAAFAPTSDAVIAPNLRLQLETGAVQFGVSVALRGANWALLTEHTLTLAPTQPWRDGANGQLSVGWNASADFGVRGGLRYRLEGGILTTLLSLATSSRVSDTLTLGAQALLEWQPVTNTSRFAFSVELGYDLGAGARIIGGVNTIGFTSPWDASTAPGAYLRFEYRLDALFALFK